MASKRRPRASTLSPVQPSDCICLVVMPRSLASLSAEHSTAMHTLPSLVPLEHELQLHAGAAVVLESSAETAAAPAPSGGRARDPLRDSTSCSACRCRRDRGPSAPWTPSGASAVGPRRRAPGSPGGAPPLRCAAGPTRARPNSRLFAARNCSAPRRGTTGGPSASRYCRPRRSRTSAPRVDGPPHSRTAGSPPPRARGCRPTCANKSVAGTTRPPSRHRREPRVR